MDHDTFAFALDISHRIAEICTLSSMLEAPGANVADHRKIMMCCMNLLRLGDDASGTWIRRCWPRPRWRSPCRRRRRRRRIRVAMIEFYTPAALKCLAKMIGDRLETYAQNMKLPDWGNDVTDAVAAVVALLDPGYRPGK